LASNLPASTLDSYTFNPSITLSGLAKYMCSNEQGAFLLFSEYFTDFTPFSSIITISPGNTSLIRVPPTASMAQDSEAKI